jgi:cardiolipin synthase (CMP-forming)
MPVLPPILYPSNQITVLRMVLVPFVILAILYGKFHAAFYLVLVAGLTDGIDGLLARKLGQQSTLGRYLDPIADKLLLNSCLLALTAIHQIPLWLAIMVLSRDVIILMTSLALILTSRGVNPPSLTGKAATAAMIVTVLLTLLQNLWPATLLLTGQQVGCYIAAVLTIVSGLQYAWQTGERLRATEPPLEPIRASNDAERAITDVLASENVRHEGKNR